MHTRTLTKQLIATVQCIHKTVGLWLHHIIFVVYKICTSFYSFHLAIQREREF